MVLNNALGLPWPTIRFFLDIKASTKTRKQPFLLFAYRKREVSSLLKSETFGKSPRNHKIYVCISVLLEYYTENN